ncbi:MAG TPA: hypothetical protein VIF38_05975 [Burkholderiales bacterium]|jgi:hypothetical protein
MGNAARWMRLGPIGPQAWLASCAGMASDRTPGAAPVVLWAQATAPVVSDLVRIEEHHYAYALIVPLRLAPGRRARWRAWGLTPALAAYRQFGLPAYLDGDAICLDGRRIAESGAREMGGCAVIASSFLPQSPQARSRWTARDLENVFRGRIEAQHGWQFDNAWPSADERAAIDEALAVEETDAD